MNLIGPHSSPEIFFSRKEKSWDLYTSAIIYECIIDDLGLMASASSREPQ